MYKKNYCVHIENIPNPLDNNTLLNYLKRLKLGDLYLRDEIINHNLFLVINIVNKYKRTEIDADDLFQVGCIGLIKAVDTFNISLGYTFSTYAYKCITNELNLFFKNIIKVNLHEFDYEETCNDINDISLMNISLEENYIDKEFYTELNNIINELDKLEQIVIKVDGV